MNEVLFVEKYRPKTITETILPERLKNQFQQFVNKQEIPNLLLSGSAGVGKTTAALAVLNELGWDYIMINGSLDRNIDTLRNDILSYISTVSLSGSRKYVILDEADNLSRPVQLALRGVIEEYSGNAGFIFTCNFKNKVLDAIQSRCTNIEFVFSGKEKAEMMKGLYKRLCFILNEEHIQYDKEVIGQLVKQYFPDARRMLNEIQRYSIAGPIDTGILTTRLDHNIDTLLKSMKEKDFKSVRKFIGENMDIETEELFRHFYDKAYQYFTPNSIPLVVLALAKYQYQDAFVADSEINRAACMVELMIDGVFNDSI